MVQKNMRAFILFTLLITYSILYSSDPTNTPYGEHYAPDISYQTPAPDDLYANNDPQEIEINWALDHIMSHDGLIFGPLKQIVLTMGQTFSQLWQILTRQKKKSDDTDFPHQRPVNQFEMENKYEPQENDVDTITQIVPEIADSVADLHDESEKIYENMHASLSQTDKRTLEIINDYSKKTLIVDAAAGGVGLSLLYAIYNNNWPTIVEKARTRLAHRTPMQSRFTGLEVPAAIGAGNMLIAPLLKPMLGLAAGGFFYWKLKNKFQRSLKIKYKKDVEQYKESLNELKAKVDTVLNKRSEEENKNLKKIKNDFKKELESERNKYKKLFDTLTTQHEERNQKLQKAIKEENKHVIDTALEFSHETHAILTDITGDLEYLKDANNNQQTMLEQANPKITELSNLTEQLVKNSEQEVKFIQKNAAQKKQPKTKKKQWWSSKKKKKNLID